ncbi:MAG TPA: TRAP transporter TatT component family protein [Vicinamibacterales bacterium]|nr:TRAP transporter TatT component family protein [Vicinamibacterales bacterium]
MMSCILVFYLAVSAASAGDASIASAVVAAAQAGDPDALYAQRDDVAKANAAAAIWVERLQRNPKDFESAWKLARARYWLGTHGPEAERKEVLELGIAAGRTASALEPKRPEGYFWSAANMGALAESFGLRQGLKYRGEIRDTLLVVLKLDPAFQQGSADRALGRWYYKVPGLFGGSKQKSEEHLRKSLTYDPNSTASHFFLAETLADAGRKAEAKTELQKVVDLPLNPDWAPEDRDFKEKARRRLAAMQ